MAIYFGLIALTLVCGFGGELVSRKKKRLGKLIKVVIPVLAFYLMASCKADTVGIDTSNYIYAYNRSGQVGWNELGSAYGSMEIGYLALNKVCFSLGLSYNQFMFVVYFLMFVPLGIVLYWRSETPTTSLVMIISLFIAMWLSALRQSIATAICVLGISCYFSKKDPIKVIGLFLVCVAPFFHKGAYMGILVLVLSFIKMKNIYLWALVPSLILLFFASPYIYQAIYYLTGSRLGYAPGMMPGGGLFFAMLAIAAILILFASPNVVTAVVDSKAIKLDEKIEGKFPRLYRAVPPSEPEMIDKKFLNAAFWCGILATAVQSFTRANYTIVRARDVALMTALLVFPSALNSFKSKSVRTVLYVLLDIGVIVLTYLDIFRINYLSIIPYDTFF